MSRSARASSGAVGSIALLGSRFVEVPFLHVRHPRIVFGPDGGPDAAEEFLVRERCESGCIRTNLLRKLLEFLLMPLTDATVNAIPEAAQAPTTPGAPEPQHVLQKLRYIQELEVKRVVPQIVRSRLTPRQTDLSPQAAAIEEILLLQNSISVLTCCTAQ